MTYIGWLALAVFVVVAVWLGQRRGAVPPVPPASAETFMRHAAAEAVDRAKREFGVDLDYSANSVEQLESILAEVHERHIVSPLPEAEFRMTTVVFGAYLGETMRRVEPFVWQEDSEIQGKKSYPLVLPNKGEDYPIQWVFKRLKNGPEDNVAHKFRFLVLERDSLSGQGIAFAPE